MQALSLELRKRIYPWLCIIGCLAWCLLILAIVAAPGGCLVAGVYKALTK